jgi:hypothetical protein
VRRSHLCAIAVLLAVTTGVCFGCGSTNKPIHLQGGVRDNVNRFVNGRDFAPAAAAVNSDTQLRSVLPTLFPGGACSATVQAMGAAKRPQETVRRANQSRWGDSPRAALNAAIVLRLHSVRISFPPEVGLASGGPRCSHGAALSARMAPGSPNVGGWEQDAA